MTGIDSLPADQRAVLELVLKRGRGYEEIAQMLSIDRAGVRQRALAAFDALGPQTRVPAQRRALITDYLLGALPDPVAEEVRQHLAESASERAWTRAVASELHGIAERPLPEIPAEGAGAPAAVPARAAATDPTGPAAAASDGSGRGPVSRLGGALLLGAAAAAVIAVVLVLVLSGGSKHPAHQATPTPSPVAAGTTGATGATGTTGAARIVAQINLKSPSGGKRPVGVAEVLRAKGQLGVAIAAAGLAANTKHPPNAYAVWLSNSSSDSHLLGFVNPAVTSNGQLKTAGGLPTNASHYQRLLVTLETKANPTTPGQVVLEGVLTGV